MSAKCEHKQCTEQHAAYAKWAYLGKKRHNEEQSNFPRHDTDLKEPKLRLKTLGEETKL